MMVNPVVVIDLRQVQFPRRASGAPERISVHLFFACNRDRDSDRTAACSDARSTPEDSCDPAASTDVVRLVVRSKLPSRVRGVEQPICASSGARGRDRDSASSGRRRQAPGIPMSSRTRQLLGRVRKLTLVQQKRSLRSVLDVSKREPK